VDHTLEDAHALWTIPGRLSFSEAASAEEALACSERCADDLESAINQGKLRPVLDRVFPFDKLPAVHDYMRSNRQFGKIVLRTDSSTT
jgi:hypothetical protein